MLTLTLQDGVIILVFQKFRLAPGRAECLWHNSLNSYFQICPPLKLKVLAPSGLHLLRLVSPLLPLTLRCFSGSFPRHEWDSGMHGIQPGVSCSPAGSCENMNVRSDECQVVTFRRGLEFVTLSCYLHLVDIFWP